MTFHQNSPSIHSPTQTQTQKNDHKCKLHGPSLHRRMTTNVNYMDHLLSCIMINTHMHYMKYYILFLCPEAPNLWMNDSKLIYNNLNTANLFSQWFNFTFWWLTNLCSDMNSSRFLVAIFFHCIWSTAKYVKSHTEIVCLLSRNVYQY